MSSSDRAKDPKLGRKWLWRGYISGPAGVARCAILPASRAPARPDPEQAFLEPKKQLVPVATRAGPSVRSAPGCALDGEPGQVVAHDAQLPEFVIAQPRESLGAGRGESFGHSQ